MISYPPFLSSVSGARMGLLDRLWDDTVAGPPPLDELRKYNSFSPSSASAAVVQVVCSIAIVRAPDASLAPPRLWGDWKRLRRKPVPAEEEIQTAQPRFPTVYDWVVISSLDR